MPTDPKTRKCHVLLLYRKMIPSVRLCGHSQLAAMSELGLLEYRDLRTMRLTVGDISWADVVFLGRLDNWYEHQLARRLRNAGKRLVYIIDDDLLSIPSGIDSASYYAQPEIQGYIRSMIDMSHAILSPSLLLLDKYAGSGRRAMKTEEPALEAVPYRRHEPDAPVKIGFAGSIDRTADLEGILRDALLRVKAKYGGRVAFEFFGAVPSFAGELGAVCVPYTDSYDEYRRKLNAMEWDIGLAPMPQTPFHACKHYNKFCEYAAAGVAGIYSDCPPYTFIPDRESFGRFCKNNPQEWYEQICAEIDDVEGREERRRRCAEYASGALSPKAIGQALYESYPDVFAVAEAGRISNRSLAWLKVNNGLHQFMEKAGRYGLRLPLVTARKLLKKLHILRN